MNHFSDYIDGWFNYADLYEDIVKDFKGEHGTFVEVGVWLGKSLSYLGVEIINSGKNIDLWCVDTWKGSKEHNTLEKVGSHEAFNALQKGEMFELFLTKISPIKHIIKPVKSTSIEAAKTFLDDSIDFLFLDASHEYLDVIDDLISWYPKIKNGGVLAGHDYDWEQVKSAVDVFCKIKEVTVMPKSNTSWIINK